MSWVAVAVGVGVGSLGLTAYSAYKQGQIAEEAFDASKQSTASQQDIANQQWSRYLDTFAPLEDQLVKEASAPVEDQPGFSRMMGTIDKGYSDTGANLRRMMGGRYPSGSGLEVNAQLTNELNRTKTKAGAVADLNEARYNKMLQAAQIGRGISTQATDTSASVGNQQTSMANMQANAAQNAWGSVGNTAGNLMQMYLLSKGGGTTPYAGAGTYGVTPSASTYQSTWH